MMSDEELMSDEEVKDEPSSNGEDDPNNVTKDEDEDEDSIMRILVATDIHLGYEQTNKRAQENDSFNTFEEILQYARDREVDMILLGGDLFHEAKPPHNVVMKCLDLLRTYCLSDKAVKIQFLTDPEVAFGHCAHKVVNYEDPNLNIGIPVFSIHGNHDDPSYGGFGTMDTLAASGLINYFGKWNNFTEVSITPLLLRKGSTTVALYGLSYMNDQRLSRLMKNEKFHLLNSDEVEDPFNILVLHQNRAQHSTNNHVSEELIPDFVNLVIWGHEHECLLMPEQSKLNPKIFISQPGSSVATSLAQGESVPKHVGILNIKKNKFKMEKLRLKTVRPFVFEDLLLHDHDDDISTYQSRTKAVEDFVDEYIEHTLIPLVAEQQTDHPKQPSKPLIRLRVFYNNDKDVFETLRLSQKYYEVVANPNDMIVFRKCTSKLKKADIRPETESFDEVSEIFLFDKGEQDWKQTIQGGMTEYFSQGDKKNKLTVLSLTGLNEALSRFVNANDTAAFKDLVSHQIKKSTEFVMLQKDNYENKSEILETVKSYRDARMKNKSELKEEEESFLNSRKITAREKSPSREEDDFSNDDNDAEMFDEPVAVAAAPKGRGRGRGRGRAAAASAAGSGSGRSANKSKEIVEAPAKRARGRTTKASAKTTPLDITTYSTYSNMSADIRDRSNVSTDIRDKFKLSSSNSTKKIVLISSDSE